jgi:hypothetical protein
MTRLETILARLIGSLPGPVTLGNDIDPPTAIVLGRLLRLGLLNGGERAALRALGGDAAALESVALERIDQGVEGRDAAESILVLLGDFGEIEAEKRILEKARALDAAQTDDAAVKTNDPWLVRLAAQNASTWWLDRIARRPKVSLAMFDAPRASALTLRRPAPKPADHRFQADVIGLDDDPAQLAVDRGTVIARMFDGDVEIRAIGLRVDEDDLPGGLCIRAAAGGTSGLSVVQLDGVAAFQSPAGFWVPIPADKGAGTLRVRFGDRDEELALRVATGN